MRPYWKGYLKLALVSCPIALHAACSSAERIGFVPRQQIDQRFFDTPYYVVPNEPVAQEAFAVIREAMRHKTMVALGRLVLCKRERVIALEPYGKGLLGTTLRYPYEVRDAKDYFGDLPELTLAPDMLALAAQILESKVADFDPHAFRDRYEEALLAHLKAKQVGTVQERNLTFATPRRVINLMDALRRSVSEDKRQPRRAGEPRALQRANRRECHAAMPTAGRPPSAAESSLDRARPAK